MTAIDNAINSLTRGKFTILYHETNGSRIFLEPSPVFGVVATVDFGGELANLNHGKKTMPELADFLKTAGYSIGQRFES